MNSKIYANKKTPIGLCLRFSPQAYTICNYVTPQYKLRRKDVEKT